MRRMTNLLALIATIGCCLPLWGQQSGLPESRFGWVAPKRCWVYSQWNAAVEPDANSKNEAERLLAEPEVRAFLDDLIQRVGLLGPALAVNESEKKQELILSIGPKLTHAMFRRDGCFFLEDVQVDRNNGVGKIRAALLMDAGSDAIQLASQLAQLFATEEDPGKNVTLGDVNFQKFMLIQESETELLIGSSDGLLLIGLGERTIESALNRIARQQVPDWLAEFKSSQRVNRVTSVGYFNVEEIRNVFLPLLGPEAEMVVGMAGLANVDAVETCSGFSETEAVSRMLVRTDGRPEGLLDLSSTDGIQPGGLQDFPKDSLFAVGLSIDPGRVFRFMQLSGSQFNRRPDDFALFLNEFKRETGVDLKQDIIENLGKTWTLHNGAGDGWMSGLTMMGTVQDGPQLNQAVNRLIKMVLMQSAGDRYAPRFVKRKIGDSELYTFRLSAFSLPVEPSWCITNERIIIGLYPQAVQTALTMSKNSVLIDQAELAFLTQPFSGNLEDAKLLAMAYADTATQFEFSYPYIQMMTSMSRNLVDQTLDLSPGATESVAQLVRGIRLPPARTIHRHLRPSLAAIRQTKLGIEFESRQTIPALDVSFVTPLAAGMLLPAVQQVRTAARRTTSANNLRQQILASLNFESAFRAFPAGYSTNVKGEKLLSWRVHILPFIEQNNLYQQFKLDEPWDSDNNKPLIEKMPDVFRSPVSKAKPGMTVYRGIGGKAGVLGAPLKDRSPRGIGFGKITDGSSNTLLLVETSDELAVPWTQPDEGLNPEDFDLSAIFGLYPSGTNVGMCDGSVHFISKDITERNFRLYMERNDGNVVPRMDEASDRPRRRLGTERDRPVNKAFQIDNGEIELTIENMLSAAEKDVIKEREKLNELRQIALAMHNFESAFQRFPSAYTTDENGQPLLSWRVHILPFLEENALYDQFHLDEPWNSQHNLALLEKMPDCFRLSQGPESDRKTTVLAVGGANGVISKPKTGKNGRASLVGVGFGSIMDGSSNTIMLIKTEDELAVEWTKPTEFAPDEATLKKMLGKKLLAAIADGSVQEFPAGFSIETFKALLTINGAEPVGDWYNNLKE